MGRIDDGGEAGRKGMRDLVDGNEECEDGIGERRANNLDAREEAWPLADTMSHGDDIACT